MTRSKLWLSLGVLLGMLCGLPAMRAQVQPGFPRFPGILSIVAGKTITFNHTSTFTTTDAQTYTFPSTSATMARTDAGQTFTGVQAMTSPVFTTSFTFANGQGLYDVAADIIGIYRSTNAQKLQIYETRTDASNYSRLSISAPSGGPITFASEAAGTGTARSVSFSGAPTVTVPQLTVSGSYITINGSNFGYGLSYGTSFEVAHNFSIGNNIFTAGSTGAIGFGPNGDPGNLDAFLKRGGGAAVIQLGADVNAPATAQTIQAANAITGSNLAGANLTIRPGAGMGTGTVSSLIVQTPTIAASGANTQSQATRLTIDSGSATFTPVVRGNGGYQSSDGTAGLTATCTLLSITSFVVKNGLVTACS